MFTETKHNYPEGYKEKPWCPNTQIILICASLANLPTDPETFCYEQIGNARYSRGQIPWLKSADYYPAASCAKIKRKLFEQLALAKVNLALTPTNAIEQEFEKAQTPEAKNKVLNKYGLEKELYFKKQETIERWRGVIFETCCSTPDDEKNVHFRQIKSPDELSESEIVDKVKQFTESLSKIIGYKEGTVGWYSNGAQNCPQAPEYYHLGPFTLRPSK